MSSTERNHCIARLPDTYFVVCCQRFSAADALVGYLL